MASRGLADVRARLWVTAIPRLEVLSSPSPPLKPGASAENESLGPTARPFGRGQPPSRVKGRRHDRRAVRGRSRGRVSGTATAVTASRLEGRVVSNSSGTPCPVDDGPRRRRNSETEAAA